MQADSPVILPLLFLSYNNQCNEALELHMQSIEPSAIPTGFPRKFTPGWHFPITKIFANSQYTSYVLLSVTATQLPYNQEYTHNVLGRTEAGRKKPDRADPLEKLLGESLPLPACYLQYMMDEWCSPYSSWLRTMKGCSCRTPTASVPLVGILAEVSAWSACSSEHGSVSGVLISVFFSALWPCRKKSCVKYTEAVSPGQAFQPPLLLRERTNGCTETQALSAQLPFCQGPSS